MRLLVVNAGSSSLKLSVLDDEQLLAAETLTSRDGRVDEDALRDVVGRYAGVDAVGHRVVHGGTAFTGPAVVDAPALHQLEELTALAPLHQPKSLHALTVVSRLLPDVPAVACFDTAFHTTIPPAAATYALPAEWRARWPLRRFGFHGLSHAYASRRAAELAGADLTSLRIVTCHLGAGASLAAVQGGVSVDTTMGFTPLEGLVMATRSGSVDAGLVLWLEEHVGMPPSELAAALEHRSGLLGLAGTADMQTVLAHAAAGDPDAALAAEVYLHRLRSGIAAMAAAMDGLDVLVFTGGVGEHAGSIRARAADRLRHLGVGVDAGRNAAVHGDEEVTADRAVVRTFVVAAREDAEIARQVRDLLG